MTIDELKEMVEKADKGVIWASGGAGIGKSYLIAGTAIDLIDKYNPGENKYPTNTLVITYRFKSDESHLCNREAFLRNVYERLTKFSGNADENKKLKETLEKSSLEIWKAAKKILGRLDGQKVIFILDGLDELFWRDKDFVREIIFDVSKNSEEKSGSQKPLQGVVWLCSGRPIAYQNELTEKNCLKIYNIGPMNEDDIGEILRQGLNSNEERKQLLKFDYEVSDGYGGKITKNSFIEKVQKCSKGYPMYIHFLIYDISQKKIIISINRIQLPSKLEDYYDELINRNRLDDTIPVRTAIISHLAIAKEPMNEDELAEIILKRGNFIPANADPVLFIKNGLAAIQSMIRLAPKPDGGEGFSIYHASLREHLLKSDAMKNAIQTALEAVCDLAQKPEMWKGKAGVFLLRWGVSHLVESKRFVEAEKLLTDFSFVGCKCKIGKNLNLLQKSINSYSGVYEILADF